MCQRSTQIFFCDALAASAARRFCTHSLNETLGTGPIATDFTGIATLVISELVTNAVHASCTQASVVIDVHRSRVRIAVADDGHGQPQVQYPSASDGHGRGLQIIERLSRAWGVSPAPEGKQVWAELDLSAGLTDGMTCSDSGPD